MDSNGFKSSSSVSLNGPSLSDALLSAPALLESLSISAALPCEELDIVSVLTAFPEGKLPEAHDVKAFKPVLPSGNTDGSRISSCSGCAAGPGAELGSSC